MRPMLPTDPLRFHGTVVWLTQEHGGRRTGPPVPTPRHDYAANGFVPPLTVDTGLASMVVQRRRVPGDLPQTQAGLSVTTNIRTT